MRLLRLPIILAALVLLGRPAGAATLTATIVFPADGGVVNVEVPSQSFSWTTVPNADSYYLYVGTSPGAKNIVNSDELHQTSYAIRTLPLSQTLYIRLWTKVAGVWRYLDSTFVATTFVPTFTYPLPGATSFDPSRSWTWNAIPTAQSYYVYVGTTVGAKDLASSGEIQATSYHPSNLPIDRVLYARLWVKIAGVWRSSDTTFTVTLAPTLVYPANGMSGADISQPVRWTTVAGANSYYLYVGSSPGLRDLVDSHEVSNTSFTVKNVLPGGQLLYARVWAKIQGVWRYSDSTFSIFPTTATLTYPPNGSNGFDQTQRATWRAVPGALAYYLYIGSSPGTRDLIDSGETQLTSFPIAALPPGKTVYARIWTKFPAYWQYADSSFSAGPIGPEFVYPRDGAIAVDTTQSFQWLPAAGAQAHWLYLGTTPGANDLLDTGEIKSPSAAAPDLPALRTVYARAWSKINGQWTRHSDIAFSPRPRSPRSVMIAPTDGATFDAGQPFQWAAAPMGRAYRLTIGTSVGGADLHDSGEIQVTRRFVSSLPAGVPLFGRLQTLIDGQWRASDFTFTVTGTTFSASAQIDSALWATDFVRSMAPIDNRPFSWTPMMADISPRYGALCSDYAALLLAALQEMNLTLTSRRLDVSFNGTNLDAHTLVEMLDPGTDRWMILDPTFDLTVVRPDGTWASAEDVSQASQAGNWSAISYVFLGQSGDTYVRNYYMDYPLLYLNVYHQGQPFNLGQGRPIWNYLQAASVPVSGPAEAYIVGCPGTAVANATINGTATDVACNAVDHTSAVFVAGSVATSNPLSSFQLFVLRRFVF